MVILTPNNPGQDPLSSTIEELRKIKNHVAERYVTIFGAPESPYAFGTPCALAEVGKVVDHLRTASIVHFSCHGIQNRLDPLESFLALHDGPLTIAKIMEQPLPNADIAFLAACQTATGDIRLPDEFFNIATSLSFAGFRDTIGTMWWASFTLYHGSR